MKLKLAGYANKRTFALIRLYNNRFDFAPAYITNSIPKAEARVQELEEKHGGKMHLHVLLDDGDWRLVTDDIYNYCV